MTFAFSDIEYWYAIGGLVFLVVVALTFRTRSSMKYRALQAFEQRVGPSRLADKVQHARTVWPFPIATILLLAIGLVSFVVSVGTILSLSAPAFILLVFGLGTHFWPGFPRELKYESVILGLGLISAISELFIVIYPFTFLAVASVVLILQLGLSTICTRLLSSSNLRTLHKIVIGSSGWLIVVLIAAVLSSRLVLSQNQAAYLVSIVSLVFIALLIVRYLLRQLLSKNPIVYLRAFGYHEGPVAFGAIVAPVATLYGPVVALVHESQPSADLNRHIGPLRQAKTEYVSNDRWQERVTEILRQAQYVIIDYTQRTASIDWELSTAMQHLPQNSILLLHAQGNAPANIPDVVAIEYGLEKAEISNARQLTRDWFISR